MGASALPYGLTPLEMDRHRRAVKKIRAELFSLRTPEECWIVGTGIVIAPLVRILRELDTGVLNRTVVYGGIEFELAVPLSQYSYRIGAQHWDKDLIWLHTDYSVPDRPARYTGFSITVPFKQLGDRFYGCLDMLAAESKASWDRRQTASK